MVVYTNEELVHPEGKIQLLNGKVLDCYPLEQTEDRVCSEMELDTTGTYLVFKKSKRTTIPLSDKQYKKEENLFIQNAFLFLQHKDDIMSDSRMFLCPIPIESGLAFTGTSGFRHPIKGVYIEWWLSCENAIVCKQDNKKWLVYRISGIPTSGTNRCGIVNENGQTASEAILSFSKLWSSFVKINKRYDDSKSLYQAYNLEEVVKMLVNKESVN